MTEPRIVNAEKLRELLKAFEEIRDQLAAILEADAAARRVH